MKEISSDVVASELGNVAAVGGGNSGRVLVRPEDGNLAVSRATNQVNVAALSTDQFA